MPPAEAALRDQGKTGFVFLQPSPSGDFFGAGSAAIGRVFLHELIPNAEWIEVPRDSTRRFVLGAVD